MIVSTVTRCIKMDVTKMTREALKDITMGTKEKDRAKNMFVLGFLYWMYNRRHGQYHQISSVKNLVRNRRYSKAI